MSFGPRLVLLDYSMDVAAIARLNRITRWTETEVSWLWFFLALHYSYCEKPDNETAEMGGVPHVEGGLNSELYAVPVKRRQPKDQKNNAILQNNTQEKPTDMDSTDSEDKDENLPPGWQKHEGRYWSRIASNRYKKELVSNNRDNCFNRFLYYDTQKNFGKSTFWICYILDLLLLLPYSLL